MEYSKLALLVVTYNQQQIKDSLTLNTLRLHNEFIRKKYSEYKLTIWNNGPHLLEDLNFKLPNWEIKNFINNAPLSWIYNHFITVNKAADFFCILDDDTEVTLEFLDDALTHLKESKTAILYLPRILNHISLEQVYPVEIFNNRILDTITSNDKVRSIGSGLLFNKSLIELFPNMKLFSERYSFYGVDTSFFMELLNLQRTKYVILLGKPLVHNLSRLTDKKSRKSFRYKERLIDQCLTIILYTKKYFQFPKLLSNVLLTKDIVFIKKFLKVLKYVKHPECLNNEKRTCFNNYTNV